MFRYRKTKMKYKNHKDEQCPFCHPKPETVMAETAHARLVKNNFPYDIWEYRNVTEHYMVVPKKHVRSLQELTPAEQMEIMQILAEYEGNNFNIYARSNMSVERTVPLHQHTHLIKTVDKHARVAFYARKPYLVAKI